MSDQRKRIKSLGFTKDVERVLLAEEKEREARDKKRVKFCSICGKRPEYPPDKPGRHIYSMRCEKCQASCVIHVNA